jgi:HPt (histidine-containing phosphotransfer) domain-containing protein
MSADSERKPKAPPVLAAALLLLLGAGGGYAFAFVSTEETQRVMWPLGAIIAAAGLYILMRFRRGFTRTSAAVETKPVAQPAAEPAPEVTVGAAPDPMRRDRLDDPIIDLDGPEIDLHTLESLRKLGGDDFVTDVMTQFISEGVLTLFKIAQSINEPNASEYGAHVHALRSSAANVGARRLYKLCLEWRELSETEIVESGAARFLQFQREFSAAERLLTERHKNGGSDVASVAKAG